MLPNIIQTIERELTLEAILKHFKVGSARNQNDESRQRYFCPLDRCRGDRRPHFVVDKTRAVDQYGKRIDLSRHINQDTTVRFKWLCENSKISGYGSLSLLAAINCFPVTLHRLTREQWATIIKLGCDILGKIYPELKQEARNGYLMQNPPQATWSISIADGFTPEAFTALSLDDFDAVDTRFMTARLHNDLGLWQVEKYIMAGSYPNGNSGQKDLFKSYERRAHSLFPIFAFCYNFETGMPLAENPEKRTDKWVARIILPAFVRLKGEDFDWKDDFWVVFNSDSQTADLEEWYGRVSPDGTRIVTSVLGDASVMKTIASADVSASVIDQNEAEYIRTTEEYVDVETNDKGKAKEIIKVRNIEPNERRLNRCVLCRKPLDAATVYMWLNYPRWRFTDPKSGICSSSFYKGDYWHVAFLRGSDFILNVFESTLLTKVATDIFQLFGNDRSEISSANTNAMRFPYLRLTMLPTSMSEMDSVDSGFGLPHIPHTPQDYFRYYEPTIDEATRNMLVVGSQVGVKSLLLQKELKASLEFRPFTKLQKKKPRVGEKPYSYEINLAAAWQMMANKGYCRALSPARKRDTIGQPYRIDGHFVYELDAASVMADMRKSLEDYAKDFSSDVEDLEMMMNAMLRCKDLQNERNITKLPLVSMPKSESYGPDIDYFFFRNGAIEITPDSIVFRKYQDLEFLIYRSQVLPFDYVSPVYGNASPITITQNEEYIAKEKEYEEARREGKCDVETLFAMRQKLKDMAIVDRWVVKIDPTEDLDKLINVPKKIIDDNEHNQWLRWWPFLRLLRCFANEDWQGEEEGRWTDMDRRALMARMANLMFTIGRCIYRYRGGVQYMPYFLENTVDREGKAQGGSGKSFLLNNFLSFVRNVCRIDGKDISANGDFAKNFSPFQQHVHDVVHIDDFPKMPIDPLFNYASGQFRSRSLFENPIAIEHEEAPNIIISSNFMVQSLDESALGRIQFGGMSHYFHREIPVLNKEGRRLDSIMPMRGYDMEAKPEKWPEKERGQIIYSLAKCLQFCMNVTKLKTQVAVPGNDLLVRLSRTELGEAFYDWFTNFLQKPWIYNAPIAINEMFNDYRAYLDPSKARVDNVSRTKFYENIQKFCAKPAHGVLFMPIKKFLSDSEQNRSRRRPGDGLEKSYLRKASSWLTRTFVDAEGKIHRARVLSKNAGDGSVTGGAVWFSRNGEQPQTAEDFQKMLDAFMAASDPEPILDENDQPITSEQTAQWTMLNTEEESELLRKLGGVHRHIQQSGSNAADKQNASSGSSSQTGFGLGEAEPDESLPF